MHMLWIDCFSNLLDDVLYIRCLSTARDASLELRLFLAVVRGVVSNLYFCLIPSDLIEHFVGQIEIFRFETAHLEEPDESSR